jgi:P27 family predicted phage terminase small subunit
VWRETEPRLRDRLNLLDIDDRILVLYCNCWQLLLDCQQVLKEEGRYCTMEDTGYVSRHPAAVDEKNAIAQIRQLASELGMTPKSGRRVKVRSGDGDALKEFLAAQLK